MQILRVFAVLFGLMALSNFTKSFELAADHGFVFLGRRLNDAPNSIASIAFGTYLAFYAEALWKRRAYALPMAIAYAGYVFVNMSLFVMRSPEIAAGSAQFGVTYIAIASGTTLAAIFMVAREDLAHDFSKYETALKTFALLFTLMALSNFLKPFVYTETTGFVLLGQRTSGATNVIASCTFAVFLLTYAQAIWTEKGRALTLGVVYATYVLLNLALWNVRKPEGTETTLVFGIAYLIIAIGVSGGAAGMLYRVRDRLA
ncbi:MAG: hypothetical protein ACI8TX_000950 [Hyphomicrobiaceae bacterium]|jgi:hypothetical protein